MIDWKDLALKHSYKTPLHMIVEWYYVEHMSIEEICTKLIVSSQALYKFMDEHRLPRRTQARTEVRYKSGPSCPHCGETKSKVVWGKIPNYDAYERARRCKKCGRHFQTIERRKH